MARDFGEIQLRLIGLRESYASSGGGSIRQQLGALIRDLRRQLIDADGVRGNSRVIEAMIKRVQKLTTRAVKAAAAGELDSIDEFLRIEAKAELAALTTGVHTVIVNEARAASVAGALSVVRDTKIRSIIKNTKFQGKTISQLAATLSTKTAGEVASTIRAGYATDRSLDQILEDISGKKIRRKLPGRRGQRARYVTYYQGGLLAGKTTRNIEALVRTATATLSNNVREELWKENDDIVKRVRYTSVLDNRVTEFCMSQEGREYSLDDPTRPGIPAHWNCRSAYIPIIRGEYASDISERPAKSGKSGIDTDQIETDDKVRDKKSRTARDLVPAKEITSFDDFLRGDYPGGKAQPQWYVEDLMGKEKAALYRSNKSMSVRDLIKRGGDSTDVRTVDSLAAKYERTTN